MMDHELLIVFNTDAQHEQQAWTTLNPNLRKEGDELELLFSYALGQGVESLASPRFALRTLKVERHGDVLCTRLVLGPAGFAICAASRFEVRIDK